MLEKFERFLGVEYYLSHSFIILFNNFIKIILLTIQQIAIPQLTNIGWEQQQIKLFEVVIYFYLFSLIKIKVIQYQQIGMVSLTTVALGVSVITTGVLSLHDALKQMNLANGFMRFLVAQNFQTNAQYALTCVKGAIQERVATRSQQIKSKSADLVYHTFSQMQKQFERKLVDINLGSLISYLGEQQIKLQEQNQVVNNISVFQQEQLKKQVLKQIPQKQQQLGFWQRLTNYKNAITSELYKQLDQYNSARRQKQTDTLYYLYDQYKLKRGVYNDRIISFYNILMLIAFGIGSFFLPKLVIMLSISYFISAQLYLISDTITKATKSEKLKNLKFENVVQFHLALLAAGLSFNKYKLIKQKNNNPKPLYKSFSVAF